jgi:hypothetical protein
MVKKRWLFVTHMRKVLGDDQRLKGVHEGLNKALFGFEA